MIFIYIYIYKWNVFGRRKEVVCASNSIKFNSCCKITGRKKICFFKTESDIRAEMIIKYIRMPVCDANFITHSAFSCQVWSQMKNVNYSCDENDELKPICLNKGKLHKWICLAFRHSLAFFIPIFCFDFWICAYVSKHGQNTREHTVIRLVRKNNISASQR